MVRQEEKKSVADESIRRKALQTIMMLSSAASPTYEDRSVADHLCKAAMDNPCGYAVILVADIKRALNDFVQNLTDTQIEWMLSCAVESRGSFNSAQAFRKYCSGEMQVTRSTDYSLLDGTLSAINYARFSKSETPSNDAAKAVMSEIGTKGTNPEHIGSVFPQRGKYFAKRVNRQAQDAEIAQAAENRQVISTAPERQISSIDYYGDPADVSTTPKKLPGRQVFAKPDDNKEPSDPYLEAALNTSTPLVGHVSGTLPGNLSIADGLLRSFRKKGLTEEETDLLAGLSSASFSRSAFHSLPECLVGLRHYKGAFNSPEADIRTLFAENVTPSEYYYSVISEDMKKLYFDSLQLVIKASSSQVQEAFNSLAGYLKENPGMTLKGLKELIDGGAVHQAWLAGAQSEQGLSDSDSDKTNKVELS